MSMILCAAWQYADPVSPHARRTRNDHTCALQPCAGRTNDRGVLKLIDGWCVL